MRAVRLESTESPPTFQQIREPVHGPGEVLIDVAACGLNFADLLMMKGQYQERPALPATLGMEIAGTIRAISPDVTGFHVGQRVAAFTGQGGLAEMATCPAARCIALPDNMPMTEASGFLVAYGTSHLALRHRASLQPNETLVVLGAAGGVGLTAVETAAQMGARVVAVARGVEKLKIAEQAGASVCLDSDTTDLRSALKDMGGVDVVYDAIGEPMASAALHALRPEGRFLAIGFAGGTVPRFPANILLVKNLTVIGLYWGGYLNFAPKALTDSLQELLSWYAQGRIKPHISHVLPFDQVFEGFELLRNRKSTGKIVISLRDGA
ncbi:NADPH:quinone oxidoreductase family protein [Roseinatronobacter alkalisoli]|uniref:NADPH:quinone oxidoreductase family protein n=1 Tax=Roseinatronobacter alkalisoli TaxID=3028235 RepID=A0ABT5T544_9RHOB|nr:NADPH:quinone oxidoreductase family protein [Roseinatronobacter sp. HJB301]MDD7970240.1 NADPH:quinone oxidoreductase family protein [Roseinatronobacter sp. HJB301]